MGSAANNKVHLKQKVDKITIIILFSILGFMVYFLYNIDVNTAFNPTDFPCPVAPAINK